MALLLRRRGIARVRPLKSGFDGWRYRGFPLESRRPAAASTETTAGIS
ncbi:MAG: hypothetical protein V3U42_09455 [candidate division NC10 bacterium]